MLERQGAQVMLDEYVPGSPRSWIAGPIEAPFGRGMNLDIRTDDVDELYEKVKASGAKIFLPIEDKWYRADDVDLCATFARFDYSPLGVGAGWAGFCSGLAAGFSVDRKSVV